jgi:uncharacterized protein
VTDRGGDLPWEFEATARTRRARAVEQLRRRALLVLCVVAVAALLAGGAVWAWQDRLADEPIRPHFERRAVPAATTTSTTLARARCRAPLTVDDPLRLWIGGDSLAGSLGPALGNQTAETGVVLPTFDSRVSSGLTSPFFFDWPKHAVSEMLRLDPEVAVFIIGANDSGFVRSRPVNSKGQPMWRDTYGLLVQQMLDILGNHGRRSVYWIGSPPLRDQDKDTGVRQIDDVAKTIVARNKNAVYIDAYRLFSDQSGHYTATLPDDHGKDVRVRTNDGIHFTPAGAELLANAVYKHLNARCRLDEQTVPGHKQPVHEAPGSSQLPPSSTRTARPAAPPPTTTTAPPPPPTTTPPPTTVASLPV